MNDDYTLVLAREEVGLEIYGKISELLEKGNSQTLGREQALRIASWALKIAGETELQHEVLSQLVELPENYG